MQLPNKQFAIVQDVRPTLLPPPGSPNDQSISHDKQVPLARQLLPFSIGKYASKELDCGVFKCSECGKGFKIKKSLEIHKIDNHDHYLKHPLFLSAEEPAIC